ncbi:MAG TPA: hypothetical protein VL882_17375 [Vicinamibacterales bacterium]|jgi:hypothetical protein|nr:hypothetical protein [Vicinamibacterales bacterium]
MKRLLRYLDTLDPALRWALFLPVGIGFSFVILGVVDAGFAMAQAPYRRVPGVTESSTQAFFAGVTRVFFPAVLSPKPWPVGIIMFALDTLLRAGPVAYMLLSYEYMRYKAPEMITYAVAGVVGCCVGLFLLFLVRRIGKSASQAQDMIRN